VTYDGFFTLEPALLNQRSAVFDSISPWKGSVIWGSGDRSAVLEVFYIHFSFVPQDRIEKEIELISKGI